MSQEVPLSSTGLVWRWQRAHAHLIANLTAGIPAAVDVHVHLPSAHADTKLRKPSLDLTLAQRSGCEEPIHRAGRRARVKRGEHRPVLAERTQVDVRGRNFCGLVNRHTKARANWVTIGRARVEECEARTPVGIGFRGRDDHASTHVHR